MLTHIGTNLIKTPRLTLRRFELNDTEAMYRNWASDPEVTRFLSWPPHDGADITEGVLAAWTALYAELHVYIWAVVPDEAGEPAGSIGATNVSDRDKRCEIGYCLGKKWWNCGYMTEALRAVIEYMILKVGFERVQAKHDVLNPASGRVMKNAGMTFEGILRNYTVRTSDGCRSDIAVYSIIKNDFINGGGKGEKK